ncbi:MAG: hypothetical protein ACK5JH_08245 [Anaerocolumna sp.]
MNSDNEMENKGMHKLNVKEKCYSSFHGPDVVLVMIKVIRKSNPLGFPVLVPILNQFWYKLQML